MKKYIAMLSALCVARSVFAQQAEPLDTATISKIKTEGFTRSKVMANPSRGATSSHPFAHSYLNSKAKPFKTRGTQTPRHVDTQTL